VSGRFESFESLVRGTRTLVHVRVRDGLTARESDALKNALDSIAWSRVGHAYGDASDVPTLLYAVTVGDAPARKAAWWELWGNIHHQGTVYSATAPAVPFIAAIANDPDHPDRVQAIAFLREVALGSGESGDSARAAVHSYAATLIEALAEQPELVQRAIFWLATAFPSLAEEHEEVVRLVPSTMRVTWHEVLDRVRSRGEDRDYDESDDAMFDREHELEAWTLAGWSEPADGLG
jgi:hypothetical protein